MALAHLASIPALIVVWIGRESECGEALEIDGLTFTGAGWPRSKNANLSRLSSMTGLDAGAFWVIPFVKIMTEKRQGEQ
jgi:hypothetical protein